MKILVTGAAGFIGSHVADRYIGLGHDVVIVDDLSTGKRENLNPAADFYELDIRDPRLFELVGDEKPDVINHHAAQIDVRTSVERPDFDADVNIVGSIKLLEAGLAHNVKRFIFASTGGAVYGEPDPSQLPADEETLALPISHYGCSKLAFERYLYLYKVQRGLDYVILRYANVYGPRQDPHGEAGVTAIFALKMLGDEPCTIFGDGTETRDYVYVDDIVESNVLALKKGTGEVYCLGRGVEVTVQELFNKLAELTGYTQEPRWEPLRPGEIHRICISGEKARRELGWEPTVEMDEGLAELVEFFKPKSQQ
jgi:UDP-glucose 4-epimerase